MFCNLDHVASPASTLHHEFLATLNVRPEDEDPSNKLLDVHQQLCWLREVGFGDVGLSLEVARTRLACRYTS